MHHRLLPYVACLFCPQGLRLAQLPRHLRCWLGLVRVRDQRRWSYRGHQENLEGLEAVYQDTECTNFVSVIPFPLGSSHAGRKHQDGSARSPLDRRSCIAVKTRERKYRV
jgi:hypothetical protein